MLIGFRAICDQNALLLPSFQTCLFEMRSVVLIEAAIDIGEPFPLWPVGTSMVKMSRAQKRTDLLLGSSVLGVLLLVAVSGAFLWLAL